MRPACTPVSLEGGRHRVELRAPVQYGGGDDPQIDYGGVHVHVQGKDGSDGSVVRDGGDGLWYCTLPRIECSNGRKRVHQRRCHSGWGGSEDYGGRRDLGPRGDDDGGGLGKRRQRIRRVGRETLGKNWGFGVCKGRVLVHHGAEEGRDHLEREKHRVHGRGVGGARSLSRITTRIHRRGIIV